jgi:hypothetical protein
LYAGAVAVAVASSSVRRRALEAAKVEARENFDVLHRNFVEIEEEAVDSKVLDFILGYVVCSRNAGAWSVKSLGG